MPGWIKLHRKFNTWGWTSKPEMVSLFVHLLLAANYEDRHYLGHIIKRGQVVFGREKWAETLGISPQSLRTCIERLKSTSEISVEITSKFSIITIVNYEEYQIKDDEATSTETPLPTNDQPAINQQSTTPKEVKNIRKDTLPTLSLETTPAEQADLLPDPAIKFFPIFWEYFPKKRAGSQDKAKVAFMKACGRDKVEAILNGVKRYAGSDEVKRGFAKGAAAWLTDDRWNNDYEPAKSDKPMGETLKRMGEGWKD